MKNLQLVVKSVSILLVLFSQVSYAQNLSLSSYLEKVKANNLDLQQANQQIRLATEDTKIARALLLPNVSLEGFYQRDFNENFLFINDDFDGTTTRFRTNFNNTLDVSATLTQTIFDPVAFSTNKIAKLAKELSHIKVANIENEFLTQAAQLYWQAIFVKESIKVFKTNKELAAEQFMQVDTLYKKGLVSKLEWHQTDVLYQKTIPLLHNAQNQYNNIIIQLKQLANIPVENELQLLDDLQSIQIVDLQSLETDKIKNQPQIQILKKELDISENEIKSNTKFWYPKMDLVVGYNFNGQDNRFNFGNNENKLYFGQLRVSIPIFSGWSNKATLAKSRLEKETLELQLKQKETELLSELQSAQNNYHNTIDNIQVHKNTIELNVKEIEIFNKQLKLGVVTPLEFKEVRLQLMQSKLALLNDYLELHIAQLQINRIVGNQN